MKKILIPCPHFFSAWAFFELGIRDSLDSMCGASSRNGACVDGDLTHTVVSQCVRWHTVSLLRNAFEWRTRARRFWREADSCPCSAALSFSQSPPAPSPRGAASQRSWCFPMMIVVENLDLLSVSSCRLCGETFDGVRARRPGRWCLRSSRQPGRRRWCSRAPAVTAEAKVLHTRVARTFDFVRFFPMR